MKPQKSATRRSLACGSELEAGFASAWAIYRRTRPELAAACYGPLRELAFAAPRRWRFDFAWPDWRVAVELEGLGRRGGMSRHQRPLGMSRDCEKYNAAAVLGWTVLRFTVVELRRDPLGCCEVVARAIEGRIAVSTAETRSRGADGGRITKTRKLENTKQREPGGSFS